MIWKKQPVSSNIRKLENELDIVITGDTASVNVTEGQFVTVRNSTITGITDGIYIAANDVSSGTAFTSADLTAVTSGALNEINDMLIDPIQITTGIESNNTNLTIDAYTCHVIGKLVVTQIRFTVSTAAIPSGKIIIKGLPGAVSSVANGNAFGGVACNRDVGLSLQKQSLTNTVISSATELPVMTYAVTLMYIRA